MCSIFSNIPPVFRRPVQATPQFPTAAYGISASPASSSSSSSYPQVGYSPASSPYSKPHQPYEAHGGYQNPRTPPEQPSESLFGTPSPYSASPSPAAAAAVRYEDRAASLKMEVTGKLQQEMEQLFKRVRGASLKILRGCMCPLRLTAM
jgi:hypothetical protein